MATLRELQWLLEANTQGLDKALPSLERLNKSVQNLDRAISQFSKNFAQASNAAGNAARQQASVVTNSANKQVAASKRVQTTLVQAKMKVDELNAAIKRSGGDSRLIANATRAYNTLEKSLKNVNTTTEEAQLRKAKFASTLAGVNRELKNHVASQSASVGAQKSTEAALIRQENAVERVRIKYLDLENALKLQGAKESRVRELSTGFRQFEENMTKGTLTARQFNQEQNKINATLARVRRNEGLTDLSAKMTDLAKTAQVALGPLSGVASRITAITSLANRNSIAIAGVIGGFVSFGVFMFKAIRAGAQFERQLARLNAVLEVTANTSGLTVAAVDKIAKRVGDATLTTQGAAREAAATLLTIRGMSAEILERSLLAAQGLSLIGRGDIGSNARRLSRILEDPANNLKSLTEAGIQFNAMEEERIKLLQLSGKKHLAVEAVLKRLEVVQRAAVGETQSLAGAWDSLTETFTSFMQDASMGSGTIGILTSIVQDLNRRLKGLNADFEVAIKIGQSYRMIMEALRVTLAGMGNAISGVINFFQKMQSLKPPSWLEKFNQWIAAGGVVGAINRANGKTDTKPITIDLDNMFFDLLKKAGFSFDQLAEEATSDLRRVRKEAEVLNEKIGELGEDAKAEKLQKALGRVFASINTSAITGKVEDGLEDALRAAFLNLEIGNIDAALGAINKFFDKVEDRANDFSKDLPAHLYEAANSFIDFKNQFLGFISEIEKRDAITANLTENFEEMSQALQHNGKTAEEAEAILKLLAESARLGSSSTDSFINSLEQQIKALQLDIQVTGATSDAKQRLVAEQALVNMLWQSGIVTAANYQDQLELLREAGLGPLVDELLALSDVISRLNQQRLQVQMQKDSNEELIKQRAELAAINMSERQRLIYLADVNKKIELANAGAEEGSVFWNNQLKAARELAEIEITKQHQEAMKSMREEARIQEAALETMFLSERTRERVLELRKKEIELERIYGSLQDARAKKELELFKILQQRDERLKDLAEMAGVLDRAFKALEDTIVDAALNGKLEWRDFIRAILADFLRINLRQIFRPLHDALGNMLGQAFNFNGPNGIGTASPSPIAFSDIAVGTATVNVATGTITASGLNIPNAGLGGVAPMAAGTERSIARSVEKAVAPVITGSQEEAKALVRDLIESNEELNSLRQAVKPPFEGFAPSTAGLPTMDNPFKTASGAGVPASMLLGGKTVDVNTLMEMQANPSMTGAGLPQRITGMFNDLGQGRAIGSDFSGEILKGFNEEIRNSVTALGDLNQGVPNITAGLQNLTSSGINPATQNMQTLANQALQSQIAQSTQTAVQTQQMGLASAGTAASVSQLGVSAQMASAQMSANAAGSTATALFSGIGFGAGFSSGGYTGNISKNAPAGVVHGREYVFDADSTRRIGADTLELIRRGARSGGGSKRKSAATGGSSIGGGMANKSMSDRVRIVNVLDKNLVGEYLATNEGEKLVMNVLRRNGYV